MRIADRIRSHVLERYIDPARSRGDGTITVVAGTVLRDLELRGDYATSVCSALRARKFCAENDLELLHEDGPAKSKQSTTTAFTYRLPGARATGGDRPPRNAVWDLLGAGRATFARYILPSNSMAPVSSSVLTTVRYSRSAVTGVR